LKLVIGQGAMMIAVGLGAGLIVAFIASQIINSLLYQVSATDPGCVAATRGCGAFGVLHSGTAGDEG
jgi:hypothetical protein